MFHGACGRVRRLLSQPLILTIWLALLTAPALAEDFGWRRVWRFGQEHGVVTCHGADLFEITDSAGGYAPARRAEIISRRLNYLESTHDLTPEQFSLGYRNGEVIIQHHEHTLHLPHIVVTIDKGLAQQIPGAKGNVERLGHWWLALFRDRLCIVLHRQPVYTSGTPIASVFEKVYAQLPKGEAMESMTDEQHEAACRTAIESLAPTEKRRFLEACHRVPDEYDPNRVIVVIAPKGGMEHGHKPHASAGGAGGGHDEAAEKKTAVDSKEPAHDEKKPHNEAVEKAASEPVKTAHQSEAMHDEKREATPETREPAAPAAEKKEGHGQQSDHAKEERGARTQTSGRFRVTLVTDPRAIAVGKETELQVKITDAAKKGARGGEEAIVKGATVRGWFRTEGDTETSPPVPAVYDDEASTYGFDVIFAGAGEYHLTVGVLTEDAEAFKVEFLFPVSGKVEEAKEETKQAGGETKGGRGAGGPGGKGAEEPRENSQPATKGSARDRALARRTADGFLELAWLQPTPTPRAVTFTLLDANGKSLATRKVTTAPFNVRVPYPAGLREIKITVEFASGVTNNVVLPLTAIKQ